MSHLRPDLPRSLPRILHPSRLYSSSRLIPESLAGKKCLVTGASRGIGLAIATRFARESARCVLVGRDERSLKKAVESLDAITADKGGRTELGRHEVRVGDVGELSFWEAMGKEMKDIDILINAAGQTHYSLLMSTPPAIIDQVIGTNLMGTIWSCRTFSRSMVRRKQGSIINIASLLALQGGRGSAAYAASKAGILGLTRSLAAEVGPSGVRVNAIVPGYIETQMTEGYFFPPKQLLRMTSTARAGTTDAIPLKRLGKAEEVADAAVFLATNAYANNCVVNLDGGLSAV
ncbi:MAG: hypothetical protein M1819_001464 [Sarea resinae]|nr:MAG: hypothetical protein M1819_001464 [Sarea resinae]